MSTVKKLVLLILFSYAYLCMAQKVVFPPVCRAELNIVTHARFWDNAGNAVYIKCEGKPRENIFLIDSMDFMIIRNGCLVDKGTMSGMISIKFNEKVIVGDVIIYSNFKSKLNQLYGRDAIIIEVPARKNY